MTLRELARAARRGIAAAAAASMLIHPALLGAQTPPIRQPVVSIKPADGQPADSLSREQAFHVEVRVPPPAAGTKAPDSITVDVETGGGGKTTVTLQRMTTGEGATVYSTAQPVRIEGRSTIDRAAAREQRGATGMSDPTPIDLDPGNGERITVSYGGHSSASVPVYDNDVQQGIGRVNDGLDQLARHLADQMSSLRKLAEDPRAQNNPKVQEALKEAVADIRARTDVVKLARELLRDGNREPLDKLFNAGELLDAAATTGGASDLRERLMEASARARRKLEEAWQDRTFAYARSYALAMSVTVMNLTMAAQVYAVATGQDIFGRKLTTGERIWAAVDVGGAVVMVLGLPKLIDVLANGGFEVTIPGRTATGPRIPAGPGVRPRPQGGEPGRIGVGRPSAGERPTGEPAGPSKPGQPTEAGRTGATPTGGEGKNWTGNLAVDAETVARNAFEKAQADAKAAGVPAEKIAGVVDRATRAAAEAELGEAKIEALSKGAYELMDEAFKTAHPDAIVVDGPGFEVIQSVTQKALLEQQGKQQTWTPEEIDALRWLSETPEWVNRYWERQEFVEVAGAPQGIRERELAGVTSFGYTRVATEADAAAVRAVADRAHTLKVDPSAPRRLRYPFPTGPRTGAGPANPAPRPPAAGPSSPPAVPPRPTPAPPPAPSPTGGRTATGDARGAPVRVVEMTPEALAKEILAKRAKDAARSERYRESPVRGPRDPNKPGDFEVMTPEHLKSLTGEELARITPDDIMAMPKRFRDALPLDRLSPEQRAALERANRTETGRGLAPAAGPAVGAGVGNTGNSPPPAPGPSSSPTTSAGRTATGEGASETAEDIASWAADRVADGTMSADQLTSEVAKRLDAAGISTDEFERAFATERARRLRQETGTQFRGDAPLPPLVPDPGTDDVTLDDLIRAVKNDFPDPPRTPTGGGSGSRGPAGGGSVGGPPAPPAGGGSGGGAGATGDRDKEKEVPPPPPVKPPEPPGGGRRGTGGGAATGGEGATAGYVPGGGSGGGGVPPISVTLEPTSPEEPKTTTARAVPDDEMMVMTPGGFPLDPPIVDSGPIDLGPQLIMIDFFPDEPHLVFPPTLGDGSEVMRFGERLLDAVLAFFHAPRGPAPRASGARPWPAWTGGGFEQSARAGGAGRVLMSLVATGASTGRVFQMQVVNATGQPAQLSMPGGLIVRAIRRGAAQAVSSRVRSAAQSVPVAGYCMEFIKQPPTPGTLYQIAERALQEKFKPVRKVLQAAKWLDDKGLLHPDSDPKAYLDFVKQWAAWTKIENWNQKAFEEAFVGRTRKNLAEIKRKWTKEIEQIVRGSVPGRWRDIQAVIEAADAMRPAQR